MFYPSQGAHRRVGAGNGRQPRTSTRPQRTTGVVDRTDRVRGRGSTLSQPPVTAQQANPIRRTLREHRVTVPPTTFEYHDANGTRVAVRLTPIGNQRRSTYVSYVVRGAYQHERYTGSLFITDDDGRYETFAPWVRQRVLRGERQHVGRTLWYADWTVTTTAGAGVNVTKGWHEWRPWLDGGGLVIIDEQVDGRHTEQWQHTYERTMVFDAIWSVALRTGVVR